MNIDIRVVTPQEHAEVLEWTRSWGHPPTPHGLYPLQVVRANDKPIGYVETIRTPVLAMGWMPGHGKEVLTAIRYIKAGAQLSYGECLALSDPKSDIYRHLGKIGFASTNLELIRGI